MNSLVLAVLIATSVIAIASSLKCRNTDGISEETFKKTIRTCAKKISENGGQMYQNIHKQQPHYDSDDYYEERGYNEDRYRQSNSRDSYQNRQGQNEDEDRNRRRNREHLQMRERMTRSNDRIRQKNDHWNGSNNGSGWGGRSSGYNGSFSDLLNRQAPSDGACIVHCFFKELNMLNNEEYPDKHKVLYILTKDIRDQQMKEFYKDSIQECFHFVENERRRDVCQFSKTLISCMAEYARANCEDWQMHSLMFN